MMRPGGYSSDEYDGSDYEMDYYSSVDNKINNEVSDEEHKQMKLRQLSQFVLDGQLQAVTKILDEEKFPIDIPLQDNWTAFMFAVSSGYLDLVEELAERGADIHQTRDTQTALMLTCNITSYNRNYDRAIEVVQYLVEKGVDVDAQNKKRMTAFLYAASNGNIPILEYLKPICNVHAIDNQGWNALFWAVNDNQIKAVQLLLDFGVDYNKIDIRRCTALDYARQHGFLKIIDLLPNSKSLEDQDAIFIGSHYEYDEEIKTPKFMRDVCVMLMGMNCREHLNNFIENPSMDLFKFLTLTKRDIRLLGITKPYQQNRILGGLYRFHKHPYQFNSIPFKGKNDVMTTNDVAMSVMAALRHFITMRASLRYLWLHREEFEWKSDIVEQLLEMEERIKQSERTVKSLRRKALKWDKMNEKVDLITSNVNGKPKGTKIIIAVPLLTAITLVLYFKYKI